MEHTKELLSVPLASLVPSRFNVRRHSVGQIEELAALIDSQGLLHNLVVTEQVFNINGIGRLLIQAVSLSDLSLIQGLVMMFALVYVLTNFAVDLIYAWLDPRVRVR